jgi:hypothetical protein
MRRPAEIDALVAHFGARNAVQEADGGWWSSCPVPAVSNGDGPVFCGEKMFVTRLEDGSGRYEPTCGHPVEDVTAAVTGSVVPNGNAGERSLANIGPPPSGEDVREVLDATHEFLSRLLVMSDDGLRVLSLWVFHSWAFDAAETTPNISIRSPERESGKTRVIEVASLIVRSSEQVADASISALFRSIEKFRSTLLFDEVDGIFRGRDEESKDLKRLLNAGYRTGATVLRTVGEQHEPKRFSTFSPKLLAGLGGLPDTLESRCVPIAMQRRLPHEQAERLRLRLVRPEAELLAERLGDVGARAVPELTGAFPEIPDELGDRAADCAEPLLAIADYAAGDWPALARKALVALQGGHTIEDESISTRLLADVRTVFGDEERISSKALLQGLHDLDEGGWDDWFGRPLSAAKMNKMLHDFSIRSRVVRLGEKTAKGFLREQFEDAWARYLLSERSQGHIPHQERENGGYEEVTEQPLLPFANGRNPALGAGCDRVTLESADPAAEAELEGVQAKFGDDLQGGAS